MTVTDFSDNLRKVDVDTLTEEIIVLEMEEIVDLNREDQIFQRGEDAEGRAIMTYDKSTQKKYNRDVKSGYVKDEYGEDKTDTRYNMFWTGRSYKNFKAYKKGRTMYITTDKRGQDLLERNAGRNIFGLNPVNAEIANWRIILPRLNEKIRNILF